MTIGRTGKEAILDALLLTKRKAQRLVVTLLFEGRKQDADKVRSRARRLATRIDDLIDIAMDDWVGQGNTLLIQARKNNRKLQAAIRDIQRRRNVAQSVVRALGEIDEIVDLATRILPRV